MIKLAAFLPLLPAIHSENIPKPSSHKYPTKLYDCLIWLGWVAFRNRTDAKDPAGAVWHWGNPQPWWVPQLSEGSKILKNLHQLVRACYTFRWSEVKFICVHVCVCVGTVCIWMWNSRYLQTSGWQFTVYNLQFTHYNLHYDVALWSN